MDDVVCYGDLFSEPPETISWSEALFSGAASDTLTGIPDHRQEPIADDPEGNFPEIWEDPAVNSTLFLSEADLACYAGPPSGEFGDVPVHREVPAVNDLRAKFPDLCRVFNADSMLTSPQKGIRRQKVELNLTEMAEAICRSYEFACLNGNLVVYQSPI